MNKLITYILAFILIFSLTANKAEAKNVPPKISADGVVLMDATTGSILYSKNQDSKYPPASTTKIMTALLALENCKLDDIVKIGKKPPFVEGSRIGILEGEKLSVKDLLYGLLLQSGNDCAQALAEHISGSIDTFSELMNKRALELGCQNTNFVNPHGLYDAAHRTSAMDLALILKELSKHKEFKEIATTTMYYIEPTNKSKEKRPIWNKNRLIQPNSEYYYEGCEGGKTGYTVQSKHSYVSVASKNGQRLIAVLLHDSERTYWSDVRKLFDYGFDNFSLETFYLEGDHLTEYTINDNIKIPLLASENFYYVKNSSSNEVPTLKINNKDLSEKSFKRGDNILTASILYKDKRIGTLNLASGIDYSSKKPLFNFSEKFNFNMIKSFLLKILKFTSILLILAIIMLRIRKKIRDKKRRKRKEKIREKIYMSKYKNFK
ncbi:D-alanyl-D-alanine carboxypeptidase [Clostridium aestuarii]|uniref:serine-type D-Ala-D-Ala carboxypeptidase n=1 Tax=Clostridium aestuarii TaxID=338193 RepID=A0ABT4CZL5_9CLOT|nr:D-alanyl-D-alanine carboxypeptidase family protein [Clostridium aestuarii]MCY6484272.1 D-alanyl-D-alanine carboxypeptidase [Clostridium aestuarii]